MLNKPINSGKYWFLDFSVNCTPNSTSMPNFSILGSAEVLYNFDEWVSEWRKSLFLASCNLDGIKNKNMKFCKLVKLMDQYCGKKWAVSCKGLSGSARTPARIELGWGMPCLQIYLPIISYWNSRLVNSTYLTISIERLLPIFFFITLT